MVWLPGVVAGRAGRLAVCLPWRATLPLPPKESTKKRLHASLELHGVGGAFRRRPGQPVLRVPAAGVLPGCCPPGCCRLRLVFGFVHSSFRPSDFFRRCPRTFAFF